MAEQYRFHLTASWAEFADERYPLVDGERARLWMAEDAHNLPVKESRRDAEDTAMRVFAGISQRRRHLGVVPGSLEVAVTGRIPGRSSYESVGVLARPATGGAPVWTWQRGWGQ